MPTVRACVLGDPDLLLPLVDAGIACDVVAHPGAAVASSRFAGRVVTWPLAGGDELVVDRMVALARDAAEPPVLLYANDRAMLLLDAHRDRLESVFRLPMDTSEHVRTAADKTAFQAAAGAAGLPVPASVAVDPTAPTGPAGIPDVPLPAVVKPLLRATSRWGAVVPAKVVEVTDEAALRRWWPTLVELGEPLLFQTLVPGPETAIESHHVLVAEDGRLLGEFTGRKIRTRPRRHGTSTALQTTHADDVAALGRRVIDRLGLVGPAKIDVKRGPDGRLWLLEVNARFTLWCHLGAAAGVNLPALAVAHWGGGPVPAAATARAGVTWIHPRDALAARDWGVGPRDWLRDWRTADVRWGTHPDDPWWPTRIVAARVAELVRGRLGRRPATPAQQRRADAVAKAS